MQIKALTALLVFLPLMAGATEPLSAIDWLSQSVQEKAVKPDPTVLPVEIDTPGVISEEILVTPLDRIKKDSVGLLPTAISGLPAGFWGTTQSAVIQDLIARQRTDLLPELQHLLYTILLAEVDAPQSSGAGSALLLARIDKLLDFGALEQAQSLMERAGPTETEIFRRWFDVSLLVGREDHACKAMAAAPGFAPTLQARVFCLARNGDWNAAALTLATGESLGFISQDEADLLAWFLDPGLFDGAEDLPQPEILTPLAFTMREAIAQPRPSGPLPRAFLFTDLRASSAWRNQLGAAERLARAGALDFSALIALYTERKPAASGGIWDRASAVQEFDVALLSGDNEAIKDSLKPAFEAMKRVRLEVAFSRHYGDRMAMVTLAKDMQPLALRLALLSDGYEATPHLFGGTNDKERFLLGLAQGRMVAVTPPNGALGQAIADGFKSPLPAGQLFDLLTENKLGEAVLRAIILLENGAQADPGDIQVALATLRAVGLEKEARRIAIQLLLIERRG